VSSIPYPDLHARPLQMTCEHLMNAAPDRVYAAWTRNLDSWFAQAGTLYLVPEAGQPYFFYNRDEWGRHPHYGRFLKLEENRLIEMTWMTGNGTVEGTQGAETILRIALTPKGTATNLHLTHAGFATKQALIGHRENWPLALELLAQILDDAAR